MARRAVIIGAGITGALVAWRLVRAGWSVTVLEARHVGAGSSSRTAAGIRQQFSTPETVLGMRYAVDYYRRFRDEVGGDTVPIVQNGYLFLYALQEDWDAAKYRVQMQQACGLDEVEALEVGPLVRRFPWVERHAVLGGTYCPTDGFLRPETVYNEAIAAARRLGAVIAQNAPVTGVEGSGGRIDTVLTPTGRYPADLVFDCTNAWSPRLARVLGGTALPIAPRKRYLWMCERAGSMSGETLSGMPLTVSPSGAYCRPENEDSLLMGWAHDAPEEPDFTYEDQDLVEPAFFHRSGPDSYGYSTWMALAEVLPPIGEFAGITATTSGYYAVTPDHNPFLGYDPQVKNLVRLVGFSGHGAMFGPFTAHVAAALAEAGHDVPAVDVLGHAAELAAFRIGRRYGHGEKLVI
ncbi:MAG: FAD-binding oxidoreductase [Pseudomonadota bacterium]|nr:FAD-binding oxidoreductase [Pseudomonadota bacterium]